MKKIFLSLFAIFLFVNLFSQQQINKTLFFDGENRNYIVYIPASYNGSVNYPLLFSFHGGAGTSSGFINVNDMRPIADTANFIAIYPQGAIDYAGADPGTAPSTSWLHKIPTSHNDVNFISAIIDTLSNEYSVDLQRIYACGYSEGGIFSYELGCRLNNKIAAFASVSGSMLTDSYRSDYGFGLCTPTHPTSVLLIPGTSDGNFHSTYSGFQPYYMSVNEITDYWSDFNNTDLNPIITPIANISTNDGSTVQSRVWENGDNCVRVEELKVIGGDHDWPGSFGNMDISASAEIWNFVSKYDINGLINCASTNIISTSDLEIKIFPNPTSDFITINSLDKGNLSYSIFSTIGKMVMKGNINTSNPKINISNLEPQLYILMIGGNSFKIIKK
jgi:polyhydroxybutyrate depolymerase